MSSTKWRYPHMKHGYSLHVYYQSKFCLSIKFPPLSALFLLEILLTSALCSSPWCICICVRSPASVTNKTLSWVWREKLGNSLHTHCSYLISKYCKLYVPACGSSFLVLATSCVLISFPVDFCDSSSCSLVKVSELENLQKFIILYSDIKYY